MEEYENWKKEVENNEIVKQNGDILVKRELVDKLTKIQKFDIIKNTIFLVLLTFFILLISLYFFYPDNYKSVIDATHICDPVINVTLLGDVNNNNLYNNFTCKNECIFPGELKIRIINGSI